MSAKQTPHIEKIGFGGGCHWCTEAYFQSLKGVEKTEQGWISSDAPNDGFSEAVIVYYDPLQIPLSILTTIHLHTHSCTNLHSMREKYRSAVYVFNNDITSVTDLILGNQGDFAEPIITKAMPFFDFRLNDEHHLDYYKKHKGGIFCERYIHPKLQMLEERYSEYMKFSEG